MSVAEVPSMLEVQLPERELTAPVDLCLAGGRLNPAAVGWSRYPIHRCNLVGGWPARKRWNFWAIMSDSHLFSITYAATDYLGILAVAVLDFASGQKVEILRTPLLPRRIRFSETVEGPIGFKTAGFRLSIQENEAETVLKAEAQSRRHRILGEIVVAKPSRHESLNVVIPWGDSRFQFTSKHSGRPARGWVEWDGQKTEFGKVCPAWGVLDFGRGVWPYRTVWNWAAASGTQMGRVVGLNLGGQWTDRTGFTENGLWVDGRLHKIGEDLTWEYDRQDFSRPWRITAPNSGRVRLVFEPQLSTSQRIQALVIGSELNWATGFFHGEVITDDGEVLSVRNLRGWSEEHRARW